MGLVWSNRVFNEVKRFYKEVYNAHVYVDTDTVFEGRFELARINDERRYHPFRFELCDLDQIVHHSIE